MVYNLQLHSGGRGWGLEAPASQNPVAMKSFQGALRDGSGGGGPGQYLTGCHPQGSWIRAVLPTLGPTTGQAFACTIMWTQVRSPGFDSGAVVYKNTG